jgi:N-acetylglucosaminyldiphosphoundecaprenol N-acetyl-beta-D-mannosaminyltransferase
MVKILDVDFYDKDIPSAIEQVVGAINDNVPGQPRCISATGAHGLVEAYKNGEFKKMLNGFYLNLPDGVPCVWVGRLKGAKNMHRCYGPDFFRETMLFTANMPIKHFFCGGKEGVAGALKEASLAQFSNNQVVGTYTPPFRIMTDAELVTLGQEIDRSGAHIVWVGIGCPKQEILSSRLAAYTKARFFVSIGAAFDFYTGNLKQAPKWMQSAGLEWFFRLLAEPRRLYKRYFEVVPMFIFLNIKEFINYCLKKRPHA